MRKLIIGCGYLGRRVARKWVAAGDDVAALTRSTVHADALRAEGIAPVVGDVCIPESLSGLPAAETILYAVGYDRGSGRSQHEIYVNGLQNTLQQVAVHARRFVYVSSTSVYGQNAGQWIDETSPCEPRRANGRVCLEAEQVVWRHFPPTETPTERSANVLRLAGIYGPNRLLRRIEQLESATALSGNPEAYLNLIHVDDAVAAVLACELRGRPGSIYVVCDNRPVRRRDYYSLLASISGASPPRFVHKTVSAMNSEGLNKRCRNRRLREELGVQLQYSTIDDGLPQAVAASSRE